MSLNELTRDSNSNKWANLNVQSITSVTENITTLNANTITSTLINANTIDTVALSSAQADTNHEIIHASDDVDDVLDISKDTNVARIISKNTNANVLQPLQIQSNNLTWQITNIIDDNETILMGTQNGGTGTIGTVRRGRHKCIFANCSAAGVIISQSGGITAINHSPASGAYIFTFNAFSNVFYTNITISQNNKYMGVVSAQPDTSHLTVQIYDIGSVGGPQIDSAFTICIFGDAL